jgi:signal transduction histidine kinase
VARIRPQLQKALPDAVPRLNHLIDTLNEGIALKRRIIEDLRPSTLDNLGLQAALEVLCADVAQRLGVPIAAQIAPVALARGAELTVFRMVQEALTNIAKHAHATTVQVRLQAEDDCVLVEVEDNGVGFVPHATGKASHGLTGMHYRVEAEGGSMSLHSQPGHGTRLVARLPRKTDAAALAPDAASGAAAPTGAL